MIEPMSGGFPGRVLRDELHVKRLQGPWSRDVQRLLVHFEQSGVEGTPRYRGEAPDGRELLTYIPGEVTIWPSVRGDYLRTDAVLTQVAELVRTVHDASSSLDPIVGDWQSCVPIPADALAGPLVVCHNDHGPWNTVVSTNRVQGLIDWDMAAPGSRMWDVACAIWHWVPFYTEAEILASGWEDIPDRMERARLFLNAYGMRATDNEILTWVSRRQEWTLRMVEWAHDYPTVPGADVWLRIEPSAIIADMSVVSALKDSDLLK